MTGRGTTGSVAVTVEYDGLAVTATVEFSSGNPRLAAWEAARVARPALERALRALGDPDARPGAP